MFGYVKPDLPYLYLKDDTLYKALYCGVCKSMGKIAGQISRLSLTYDIAFLSAVAHNLRGEDVEIKKERCIAHPILPKPMASRDTLTETCAAANVILAYYKIKDDVIDGGRGKGKLLFFKNAFKRANKRHAYLSEKVELHYANLRVCEERKEDRIDVVSDCFSLMLKDISRYVLGDGASENSDNLFYFLGKWIYLVDALDDYDKDLKKGNYNPFYFSLGKVGTKREMLEKHGKEISFIFADIFASVKQSAQGLEWKFNHDLIDNILLRGLPSATMKVMSGKTERGGDKK